MISNEEKINIIIGRLNNIQAEIKSYIDNAELIKDKCSVEDELLYCDVRKRILLATLYELGGSWQEPLTNQG